MPAIYRNLQSKCIEIIQFAFMCTICTRVQILKTPFKWPKIHPGCKFAPPRRQEQICTRVQILKTPFTWPKIHPGCANLHPGANCAHERGLDSFKTDDLYFSMFLYSHTLLSLRKYFSVTNQKRRNRWIVVKICNIVKHWTQTCIQIFISVKGIFPEFIVYLA